VRGYGLQLLADKKPFTGFVVGLFGVLAEIEWKDQPARAEIACLNPALRLAT
jgi:hypothetical protein